MNLAHLYYFRKLVEVKNYSRAAEELFIAQPTLSLAVSSLERELGCILVKKRRNALELTEEARNSTMPSSRQRMPSITLLGLSRSKQRKNMAAFA